MKINGLNLTDPATAWMADKYGKYASIAVSVAILSVGMCAGIVLERKLDRIECHLRNLSELLLIQSALWPESLDQRIWTMPAPSLAAPEPLVLPAQYLEISGGEN